MKKMILEMPEISRCSASQCAYNVDQSCHAKAITVGDGQHAGCDTFFAGASHTKSVTRISGVGACKVTACRYNQDLECTADRITVGSNADRIDCLTYSPRRQSSVA